MCFLLSGSHAVKIGLRLLRQAFYLRAVVHYLKVVVVTEYPLVPLYCLARGVNVSAEYGLRDLAGKTGGTAYKVFVILFYYLVRDPRLVVHSLDVRSGDYLHQVAVTIVVFGQQYEMIVFLVCGIVEIVVITPGYVHLTSNDRLYDEIAVLILVFLVVGVFEKFLYAVHIAVVGDGKCRHSEFTGTLEKRPDIAQAIKNGILCMDVKVYERHGATTLS